MIGVSSNNLARLKWSRLFDKMESAKEVHVDPDRCDAYPSGYPAINQYSSRSPSADCEDIFPSGLFARENPANVDRYEIVLGGTVIGRSLENAASPSKRVAIKLADFSDEEAFRLAERVNRQRQDITPFVHSTILATAFRKFYASNIEKMSSHLGVDKRDLRISIDLAGLAPEILAAFGDLSVLEPKTVAPVVARLRNASRRNAIMVRAAAIAADSSERLRTGAALRAADDIVKDLCSQLPITARKSHVTELRSLSGELIAKVVLHASNEGSIIVMNPPGVSAEERQGALQQAISLL